MIIRLIFAALSITAFESQAAFNPVLNQADQSYLHFLLAELPGEIQSRDPARIQALEAQVANFALNERAKEKSDLELAVATDFWSSTAAESKWMIQSSISMIRNLEQAGKSTPETEAFLAALEKKKTLFAQTEKSLDTSDPANLSKLLSALDSVRFGNGVKLSAVYLRLRAIYVPLHLPPAFDGITLSPKVLPGLDLNSWDATMEAVEKEILASPAASSLPLSIRGSFIKSIEDLFFTYKFPLLDLQYAEILDPQRPNPNMSPSTSASEALSTLRSLERVLQITDVFKKIDRAGGGLTYVRSFQARVSPIEGLCDRWQQLENFTSAEWKKIHSYNKVIVLDPGHLGGEYADDNRNVSPPNEKGQESYGYREGHDTFVVANLARRMLVQCAGLPEENILLTRRGLDDEGGVIYDKAGFPLQGQPGPSHQASDNLFFRKVVITLAEPAFAISLHTDWSNTLTQHGLIIVPHPPASLEQGYYKSEEEYAISLRLAKTLAQSLGESMFSSTGMRQGESAEHILGDEFREYYLSEMDLQIFRDFHETPVVLVEGYDYASPSVRALMNAVARGHKANDGDVKSMTIDGSDYYFHVIHQSYAEGVALGALHFILAP